MDVISYTMAKKYSNMVALGLSSAVVDDTAKTITFTLAADGSQHTIHFDQPKDGVSITNISIDANNNLVCTMSDGTEYKSKIDLLDNVYTKSETDTLLLDKAEKNHNHDSAYASKDTEHEHSNKETLDKFGVNDGGKLTFNGDVVTPEAMDLGDYLKKTDAQNTYVEKETGKGLSENDFTTVLKDAYDKAVEDSHTHSNKSIIDKFSEDSDGKLLYDGQSIEADLSTVYKKTETYSQTESDDKFVAKESGKGLSANDLTDELKSSYDDAVTAKHTHENGTVLDGITAGKVESWDKAEENVQSDWNETDDTADGFIKNKPTIPTKVSQLENDSNYLSSIPEEYVTETELSAKGYLTEHQDISGKVDKVDGKSLIADTEIERLASVDNYDDTDIRTELANKADATAIPSKVSVLENDSKYQTESDVTTTLTDYATKTYVGEQIANAEHLKREIVTVLPSDTEASDNIIYMLKVESATGNDKYQEYMKIDGTVQMVGDTSVDLTDYIKTSEVNTKLEDYAKTSDVNASIKTLQTDKANTSDLTAHTGDSVIHVTAENKTLWNTVSNKVNKEDGKALLADTDKTNYDDAVTKAHTHENKEVLDGITSDKVTYWDNKSEFSGSYNDLNDKPTIDAELSNTSENAIQNKVVTKEINKLYSDISFNDFDTATDGISFTDAEDGNMLVTDCTKNLLNPTLETTTQNGVTCTNNGDGTYTLNGTATADTRFDLITWSKIAAGNYRVVGCPVGGSHYGYYIDINAPKADEENTYYHDIGNGATFEVYDQKDYNIVIRIAVIGGITVSNIVFKPMLTTDLNATYDDFVPYSGYDIKTCGKNLVDVNSFPSSAVIEGITFTTDKKAGTITLNGTATGVYNTMLFTFNAIDGIKEYSFGGWDTRKITPIHDRLGLYSADEFNFAGLNNKTNIEYNKKTTINMVYRTGDIFNNFVIKPYVSANYDTYDGYDNIEPYKDGGTVHVDHTTEFPLLGLKSFDGETNIISPGNVKCVYPTNESGKGVLDLLYNKDKMLTEQNDSLSVIGKCKNLLNPTLETTTLNGVTCTRNVDANGKPDGTYTLNGTASSQVILNITQNVENKFIGNKLLGCPSGGSDETYSLLISYFTEDDSWLNENYDLGNGTIIKNSPKISVSILIRSGTVCNNLVFKPMLTTNLNATYDDFVPYTGDGDTLTHDVAEIKNDLGGLSFSASGTALTITDGTHTWTLEANS